MKRSLQLVSSLAVTVVCLAWTFKGTHWAEMWASLRTANYFYLLPYLGILTAIHLCRTLRWGSLLSGLERVRFRPLNEASAIGFMLLIILPFRLGEFARPLLIAQRSAIRRSAAMTTVVLERIVDGLTVAMMLWVLLVFVPETPEQGNNLRHIRWGANVMFAVFGGGLAFLLFSVWQHDRAVRFVRAVTGWVSPGLGDKVAAVVDSFVGAMKQLPGPGHMALFFLYTAVYWGLNGWGMSVLASAFDCSGAVAGSSCQPLSLSLFQGYVALAVLVVGLMIPAAPGGAGTFQAFVLIALSVFNPQEVVKSSGVAYANVLWLIQMAQQILFGWLFAALSHQSILDIFRKLNRGEGTAVAETAQSA